MLCVVTCVATGPEKEPTKTRAVDPAWNMKERGMIGQTSEALQYFASSSSGVVLPGLHFALGQGPSC